ncbi:MAG: nucleotidyl transferase AbiEii/AbiGii toxin family protein [Bacteroidales bacterium]|nr:nucleotidyl transferase AbiEii/AbiGii toxin family protein [Bacteroidales bacterium]
MGKIKDTLHYETVTPILANVLSFLMNDEAFNPFRLVGGTNLSLRFGHRQSDDIDLFTDSDYGSIDFSSLEKILSVKFPFFDSPDRSGLIGFGRMYYVGLNRDNAVKLDLMYTDKFLSEPETIDGIRFASIDQIAAMKLSAISLGGRKKDWWDVHKLLEEYSLEQMFRLYEKWQPWTYDQAKLMEALVDFSKADLQPDPKCLEGKDWDIIKIDIINQVRLLEAAKSVI